MNNVQSKFGMRIKSRVDRMFFDRQHVIDRVGKARAKFLNRAGGKVRLTAQRSLRKRDKPSAPGAPPSSHDPHWLRNLITYSLSGDDNAIVGPEKLNKVTLAPGLASMPFGIPEALEHGGAIGVVVEQQWHDGAWHRIDYRRKESRAAIEALREKSQGTIVKIDFTERGGRPDVRTYRARRFKIAARPFMGPALEKNVAVISKLWADTVTA